MLINLFVFTQIIYIAAEVYNDPSDQYAQHIWHSYTFNTGSGNREELHFSRIGLNKNFTSANDVFMWKSLQVQEEIVIVGLATNFLLVTVYSNETESYTYKKEMQYYPVGLSMFQKWDASAQEIKHFVIVLVKTSENSYILKWYQINNKQLEFLWDWSFHKNITYIDVIKINNELKLLVISHQSGANKNPSADIYSFNIKPSFDIWLFEKINLDGIPSTVSVFNNNDNTFLSASFPSIEMIHIYKYTRSLCSKTAQENHFISHQKIYSNGLKSLVSFRISFHWYLAVASKQSSIYHLKDDFLFYPINNLSLGSHNYWFPIPIYTYREDVMLLSDSSSDVSIITWRGDERLQIVGSFTELACGNDIDCLEKMHKIQLKKSTAFYFEGHQNILISANNGKPLLFKLLVKLQPLPDKVMLKLNKILKTKAEIKEDYDNQVKKIEKLVATGNKKSKEKNEGETVREIFFKFPDRSNDVIPTYSHTKYWEEMWTDVNKLKSWVHALSHDINKVAKDLRFNSSSHGKHEPFLPENVSDGITFYGDVIIEELDLSTLNGHDVNDLMRDSFRKNKTNKIGGTKILKNLNVENISFEKIGGIAACDIVYTDDLWEEDNNNVINGDVAFEGKLHILNDLQALPETGSTASSSRGKLKQHFEKLDLEELEITEETHVQGTINSQLFILPVHSGHLNIHYLDIVNQARVELVNVKNQLDVDFINGKNFTELMGKVSFKNQKRLESAKVDGVFRTGHLQARLLNDFDIGKEIKGQEEGELIDESSSSYLDDNYLKNARSRNPKRVIHVYQNVEVDGNLFSEKINNITWALLNDTVRKNEQRVAVTGEKIFQKPLKAKNISLSGTLNGKSVEYVMTSSSDQIIKLPQVFDRVKFKNLSLKGLWDGVCVKCLNESVVRLSVDDEYGSSLTFGNNCLLHSERLNVTDFVNDVEVNEEKLQTFGDDITLKSIKASQVILHGHLTTNDKINSINFTNFNSLRVRLNGSETVEKNISQDTLSVTGSLHLTTLNDNDISSIISSGGDTKLIDDFFNGGIHRIKKLCVKGNVSSSGGVNGFNLSKIFEKGVCIKKPNWLKGNITFENTVHFNDINITGSADGFFLKELEKDIVFKHSHVFLNGEKSFTRLKVTKDMKARSLNGHLMQDVASLKGDQSMNGLVVVNGNAIVRGNVTVYGRINDVPVSDLLKKFSTHHNSFIHPGDLKSKESFVTIDNLAVGGNIQGRSFEATMRDAVLKDGSFNITGRKFFKGKVKFKENVWIEGEMNGVNFSKFLTDVAFINKPEKLEGVLRIKEAVLNDLEAADYFNSSLINDFKTDDWFEDIIPLDRYVVVSGKKDFENASVSEGVKADFINGHLPSAMIPLKGKQHVPLSAFFPRIHTDSDLSVEGLVNDKNLMKEYEDTVLLSGPQTITSETSFSKKFVVDGNLFVESLRGKRVDSLITLDTEQNISSPLEFQGSVTAKGGVGDLKTINDISLGDWSRRSVALNREQVVNGSWKVKGRVKAKNIEGEGLLNEINLRDVSSEVRKDRVLALETKNETDFEFLEQCSEVKEISQEFTRLPYLFQKFEVAHEIETSYAIDSVIDFKINNTDHIIVTFESECSSLLYRWNEDNSTFDYLRQINLGPVSEWSVSYRNNATYLVTSSSRDSTSCEENFRNGNFWVFEGVSDKYVHLLTTDGFVDITRGNTSSGTFFTLKENGDLHEWTLGDNANISSKLIMNVEPGNNKFIDFTVTGGLAFSNGKEIKQIDIGEGKITERSLPVTSGNIVALPLGEKTLVAVVVRDKIVIYEDISREKIFSVLHTYRAGSVLWFNFGPKKQAFLIIASHHKLIEVYEYKSVSGLVRRMSIQIFSTRLQSMSLPSKGKHQPSKFVAVVQKKKIIFLKADMLGDYSEGSDLLC